MHASPSFCIAVTDKDVDDGSAVLGNAVGTGDGTGDGEGLAVGRYAWA